jgi:long-chain acyl-CoA synthetase
VVTALPLYHICADGELHQLLIGAENWLVLNPRDMDGFVEVPRKARGTDFTGVNSFTAGC